MPTYRDSLRRLSVSQLVELTDMAARTVTERLRAAGLEPAARDGRTLRFDPQRALPALYEAATPQAERARLDRARAEAQELANAKARGELIPAADEDAIFIGLSTLTANRLGSLPDALAPELAAEATVVGCKRILADGVHDALSALANEAKRALERLPDELVEEAAAP